MKKKSCQRDKKWVVSLEMQLSDHEMKKDELECVKMDE